MEGGRNGEKEVGREGGKRRISRCNEQSAYYPIILKTIV
jgi:hypothetical protein